MGGLPITASSSVAPSRWTRLITAGESLADAGNPVTVRLLRQQARSLTTIIVLSLLLVGGVIATAIACAMPAEFLLSFRTPMLRSELLFLLVVTVWTAVAWIAQPVMFIAAIRQERDETTWDLLDLTGMAPLRILCGVIGAAAIQQLLLLAMMAPFLVMAWMLNGVDPLVILLAIFVIPLNGLITTSVGIKGSITDKPGGLSGRPGRAAIGASLAWLLAMFLLWMTTFERGFHPSFFNLRALDGAMVVTILLMTNLALHVGAAALVDAAMRLTHPSANRSTPPRMLTLVFVANLALVLLGFVVSGAIDLLMALAWTALGTAAWNALSSIDGIAEPFAITRRQAEWCARHRGLWRLFAPGAAAARQFHLALALPALLAGITTWWLGYNGSDGISSIGAVAVGAVAYGFIILMIGDLCARGGDLSVSRPLRHRRVIWGIIILGTLIAGFVVAATQAYVLAAVSPILGLVAFAIAGTTGRGADDVAIPVVLVCLGGVVAMVVMIDQARHRPVKRSLRGEPR